MKSNSFCLFLLTGCLVLTSVLWGDVYIISNSSTRINSISKKELKQIFLGEMNRWKDGSKIKIVDNLDKKTAENFYSKYVGKKTARIKQIWIKKMLRGKMSPPESLKYNDDIVDYVSNKKHCIGFVSGKKAPKGVKVLKVTE
ncbi:MAG: hypothetical protein GY757_04480 [bacterium]|nr:hypothetical protein [bacterium]